MLEDKLPKNLNCLLSHDKQANLWVSHCLDFDLVTSGASEDEAWDAMKRVAKSHIESCFRDSFAKGLSRRAESSVWAEYVNQVHAGRLRSDLISLDLKHTHETFDLRMKGARIESLPSNVPAVM
jgi:hypothetical protein